MKEAYFMTVTQEMAIAWLNTSKGNPRWGNKLVDRRKVERIKSDIIAGKWNTAGDSIKFDTEGCLCDGHHRLSAIAEVGIPCECLVVLNVPKEALFHIDDNDKRKLSQRTSFSRLALSMPVIFELLRTNIDSSVSFLSDDKKIQFFTDHPFAEEASVIVKNGKRKNAIAPFAKGSCAVAILTAYEYGVPVNLLEEFAQAVNSGYITGESQSSAITLYHILIDNSYRSNSPTVRKNLANFTQNAIRDFVTGTPRRRKYSNISGFYFEAMRKRGDIFYQDNEKSS